MHSSLKIAENIVSYCTWVEFSFCFHWSIRSMTCPVPPFNLLKNHSFPLLTLFQLSYPFFSSILSKNLLPVWKLPFPLYSDNLFLVILIHSSLNGCFKHYHLGLTSNINPIKRSPWPFSKFFLFLISLHHLNFFPPSKIFSIS